MKRATAPPPHKVAYNDESEPVQRRVYKSLKLWSMYADLEESLGTFKSCKAVYDRIIDLRIATPQIIINYGMFLQVCLCMPMCCSSSYVLVCLCYSSWCMFVFILT